MTFFLVVLITALVFEYINGFHDAANAIATVVSTKVLTPRQAVMWAAFWNLVGALAGTAVASRLLGLDEWRTENAIAITVSQAAGTFQHSRTTGGAIKRNHMGFAAANGVSLRTTTADLLAAPLPVADLILVGDLFYERQLAEKVLAAIDYWREAPLWDPASIAQATRTWFDMLSGDKK